MLAAPFHLCATKTLQRKAFSAFLGDVSPSLMPFFSSSVAAVTRRLLLCLCRSFCFVMFKMLSFVGGFNMRSLSVLLLFVLFGYSVLELEERFQYLGCSVRPLHYNHFFSFGVLWLVQNFLTTFLFVVLLFRTSSSSFPICLSIICHTAR